MAIMGSNAKNRPVAAADDLYLILLILAAALLLFGLVFVAVRSVQYFDSLWPVGGV